MAPAVCRFAPGARLSNEPETVKSPPAFQFYVGDFVEGTSDMTDSEVGLYVRLLCAQWTRGSLPADNSELARFSHGSGSVEPDLNRVRLKFELGEDGRLRNARMERERQKQLEFRERQRVAARGSVEARLRLGSGSVEASPSQVGNRKATLQSSVLQSSSSLESSVPQISQKTSTPQPLEALCGEKDLSCSDGEKTSDYHKDSRTVLWTLNELSGSSYREVDANLTIISQRLKEPEVDVEGVRVMIARQVKLWKGSDMEKYLRPATLFAKTKFDSYYGQREKPIHENNGANRGQPTAASTDPRSNPRNRTVCQPVGPSTVEVLARREREYQQAKTERLAAQNAMAAQVAEHGGNTPTDSSGG